MAKTILGGALMIGFTIILLFMMLSITASIEYFGNYPVSFIVVQHKVENKQCRWMARHVYNYTGSVKWSGYNYTNQTIEFWYKESCGSTWFSANSSLPELGSKRIYWLSKINNSIYDHPPMPFWVFIAFMIVGITITLITILAYYIIHYKVHFTYTPIKDGVSLI
jgi:hypothetical protein